MGKILGCPQPSRVQPQFATRKLSIEPVDFEGFRELLAHLKLATLSPDILPLLEEVHKNIKTTGFFMAMPNAIFDEYLHTVFALFARKIKPVPFIFLYSDSRMVEQTDNWPILEAVYSILNTTIFNADTTKLSQYLDRSMVETIVGLMATECPDEQNVVENLTGSIFETIPGQRQTVFSAVLRLIKDYNESPRFFNGVAPALRFLYKYLKSVPVLRDPHYDLFRRQIYPMYGTIVVSDFAEPLNQITSLFLSRDSGLAEFCINYLLKHWPICSSSKQVVFFEHIPQICQYLRPTHAFLICKDLFTRIAQALDSPNFKITMSAITLLLSPTFVFLFQPYGSTVVPIVFDSILRIGNHWNTDVRKMSKPALRALYTLDVSATNICIESQPIKDVSMAMTKSREWNVIYNTAVKNSPELAEPKFPSIVDSIFPSLTCL